MRKEKSKSETRRPGGPENGGADLQPPSGGLKLRSHTRRSSSQARRGATPSPKALAASPALGLLRGPWPRPPGSQLLPRTPAGLPSPRVGPRLLPSRASRVSSLPPAPLHPRAAGARPASSCCPARLDAQPGLHPLCFLALGACWTRPRWDSSWRKAEEKKAQNPAEAASCRSQLQL